jgi:threonine dehydratase
MATTTRAKQGEAIEPGCTLTFQDVLDARARIAPYLRRTPVVQSPALDESLGCEAFVKCENLQPIGAFKVRGGMNLMLRLTDEQRRRGVVTASTGNHGQSVAYAARLLGTKAIIHVPERANPLKVESICRLGAEIVMAGKDFDQAKVIAEQNAQREGMVFISSGDEPDLIAGVATACLELFEDVPDLDMVLVPVGGGSGASGACLARDGLSPDTRIIGVQASQAPAVSESWRSGHMVSYDSAPTFADGLATREPFMMPLQIMRAKVADFWLVGEEDMKEAIRLLARALHVVAEGAGAAATAAALRHRSEVKGRRVGLMLSGGNLPLDLLQEILAGQA